jgi:hypothetical protein
MRVVLRRWGLDRFFWSAWVKAYSKGLKPGLCLRLRVPRLKPWLTWKRRQDRSFDLFEEERARASNGKEKGKCK